MRESCLNCRFWVEGATEAGDGDNGTKPRMGECHKELPQVVAVAHQGPARIHGGPPTMGLITQSYWPPVSSHSWCGKREEKG